MLGAMTMLTCSAAGAACAAGTSTDATADAAIIASSARIVVISRGFIVELLRQTFCGSETPVGTLWKSKGPFSGNSLPDVVPE
jgi:hypothetical protein